MMTEKEFLEARDKLVEYLLLRTKADDFSFREKLLLVKYFAQVCAEAEASHAG